MAECGMTRLNTILSSVLQICLIAACEAMVIHYVHTLLISALAVMLPPVIEPLFFVHTSSIRISKLPTFIALFF